MTKSNYGILSVDDEYNLLMSAMDVSVSKHMMNDEFTVIWANDYYYKQIGYTREEYEAKYANSVRKYYEHYEDIYQKIAVSVMNALEHNESGYDCICQMPQKGGSMIWIKIRGLFTDEIHEGNRVIYSVFTDISDLVQSEKEKTITSDKLPGFMAKFKIRKDMKYEVLESNERFQAFFGENPDPIQLNIQHMDAREAVNTGYQKMLNRESLQFEASSIGLNGEEHWFQISGEYVGDIENDPIYYFVFIDITRQKKDREKIETLAFVDPITEGYNRNRFELEMEKSLKNRGDRDYYFISLNMEKFKLINDISGIEKGDRTLHYISDVFISYLREGEHIGRFAADRFMMLLYANSLEELTLRIESIVERINSFNDGAATKYYLNFKAGVYCTNGEVLPFATMYDRANMAIKNARYSSDNQLVSISYFRDVDRLNLMKEKEIEDKVGAALDNNEFVVYLQPKVSVQEKSVAGAEALVRWNDPQEGLLYPDVFIPILENNGSIVKLDLYVFDKVCKMIRKWLDAGYEPIPISVNMSRVHTGDLHFIDQYENIRRQQDIPAHYIEIELTETMIFDNPELYVDIINRIHEAGYSCSMDDFGSGYSSLNTLRDLHFDCLKLDKTFFSFEHDKRGEDIIESIVDMAEKLGMTSVAEGVETNQQVEFLQNTACDLIQGYVYSRPIPLEEFEKMKFGKVIEEVEKVKDRNVRTQRLILRSYLDEDKDPMIQLLMNEEIKKTYMIPELNEDQAEALFKKLQERSYQDSHYERAICQDDKVIGFINDTGIQNGEIEVGYVIHPAYHNKGYASEALSGAIQDLFHKGFHRVSAGAFAVNIASCRVMEKCGMKRLAKTDKVTYHDIEWDCVYYAIDNRISNPE